AALVHAAGAAVAAAGAAGARPYRDRAHHGRIRHVTAHRRDGRDLPRLRGHPGAERCARRADLFARRPARPRLPEPDAARRARPLPGFPRTDMNDTTAAQAAKPQLSVIVPVGARRAGLKALYADSKAGVAALGLRYEFIFVLDGPRLDAARTLDELRRAGEEFMVVRLTRYFGEAAALMAGFERCT